MFNFKVKKRKNLKDNKSFLRFTFWNLVNQIVMRVYFKEISVIGKNNLPDGAFILVANHSSRWDGLVVQFLLNRRANYMVSPNEMKGLQGRAVKSVGAFPSNSRHDLVSFSLERLLNKEPIVVFPEGNIFKDDYLHPFKKGAAKIALEAVSRNHNIPIVPLAIEYKFDQELNGHTVCMHVGNAYIPSLCEAPRLAEEMHLKVKVLKEVLSTNVA